MQPAAAAAAPVRALGDPRAVTPAAGPLVTALNAVTDILTDGRGHYHAGGGGGAPTTFTSAYVCTRATLSAGIDAVFDGGNAAFTALTSGWAVAAALLGVAWGVAFVQVLAWLHSHAWSVGGATYLLLLAAWRAFTAPSPTSALDRSFVSASGGSGSGGGGGGADAAATASLTRRGLALYLASLLVGLAAAGAAAPSGAPREWPDGLRRWAS